MVGQLSPFCTFMGDGKDKIGDLFDWGKTWGLSARTSPETEIPNKHVVTSFLLGGDEGEFVADQPELTQVAGYFDRLIATMGCEESHFFQNEDLKRNFCEKLVDFGQYLDTEISYTKNLLDGNKECSSFSENWIQNVKKAAYYAFFIHYGAKRRGETDHEGGLSDYVRHVVRSGFNCLMRKMRFFDEKTLLATILHDVKEDYDKGFLALLQCDRKVSVHEIENQSAEYKVDTKRVRKNGFSGDKRKLFSVEFGKFTADLDKEAANGKEDIELTIGELVDIVTKKTDDRNRALLDVFSRIIEIKDKNKRFSAFNALMIKMADRLDNIRSFMSDKRDGDVEKAGRKSSAIEDETVYVFLAIAKKFGMVNVADWFYDYLYFKNFPARREMEKLRQEAHYGIGNPFYDDFSGPTGFSRLNFDGVDPIMDFRTEFMGRLYAEIKNGDYESNPQKWNEDSFAAKDFREGKDYIFSLRSVGKRYEDAQRAQELVDDGQYSKSFLNFIIFHPIGNNPELAKKAREVFKYMFPFGARKLLESKILPVELRKFIGAEISRGEYDTDLGRLILNHGAGSDFTKNNFSYEPDFEQAEGSFTGYGVGVWGVFDSQREAVDELLGDFHVGSFYNDSDAQNKRREVTDFFVSISEEIKQIKSLYQEIEPEYEGDENEGSISTGVRKTMGWLPSPFREDQKEAISRVLAHRVMTLFMPKRVHETKVSVNGKNYFVRLPESSNIGTALLYSNPLLAGKGPYGIHHVSDQTHEGFWNNPVESYFHAEGEAEESLCLSVNEEFGDFDPALFDKQAWQLSEVILPEYKNDLMNERMVS